MFHIGFFFFIHFINKKMFQHDKVHQESKTNNNQRFIIKIYQGKNVNKINQ